MIDIRPAPAGSVITYTLIQAARLNDVDPQAWLAVVLARINDHKITDLLHCCRGAGQPSKSGLVWQHKR